MPSKTVADRSLLKASTRMKAEDGLDAHENDREHDVRAMSSKQVAPRTGSSDGQPSGAQEHDVEGNGEGTVVKKHRSTTAD
jgi:hypothetical protein